MSPCTSNKLAQWNNFTCLMMLRYVSTYMSNLLKTVSLASMKLLTSLLLCCNTIIKRRRPALHKWTFWMCTYLAVVVLKSSICLSIYEYKLSPGGFNCSQFLIFKDWIPQMTKVLYLRLDLFSEQLRSCQPVKGLLSSDLHFYILLTLNWFSPHQQAKHVLHSCIRLKVSRLSSTVCR